MTKIPRKNYNTRGFNENGSQFAICVGDNSGISGLDKIIAAARDERDNPLEPIAMKVTVKE